MSSRSKPQGGILRSKPKASASTNGDRSGHVSFSSSVQTSTFQPGVQDDDDDDDDEIDVPPRQTNNNEEYDSDDDDAILASGEGLSMSGRMNTEEDEVDGAFHSASEIKQAKRRRGDARHQTDDFDDMRTTSNDRNLSLITDHNADPDEYQSNAGANASCPVEPFNMDAEKEGGLGYFDGDTYVFRKNKIDGEEDAWLDGFEDENEEISSNTKGGLDSMSIWKPKDDVQDTKRKASKYVSDGATQEEIGARLVVLLENEETVMMALTRHGSTLRQLQSQEQKLAKKSGIKKRKAKSDEDDQSSKEDSIDQIKERIKQVRDVVEELTELADALLFEGEADAYELTKADWAHRFKLDGNSAKRPSDSVENATAKKPRHNFFGDSAASANDTTIPQQPSVMWEYKGNEDGVIHGPYTSQQMLEWTSCGYFVGASAVDIRQVGRSKTDEKIDADDLMADLMGDDEEKADAANEWMRSDAVDFNAYL
jgi:CD2 antigen cytoplasmic tail-binding protein 2